jgi:hypothetical protein
MPHNGVKMTKLANNDKNDRKCRNNGVKMTEVAKHWHLDDSF